MALRTLANRFRCLVGPSVQQQLGLLHLRSHSSAGHGHKDEDSHSGATPTVFDKLVQLQVVDLNGDRHTVKGLEGKSLVQALIEYGFPKTYFFPNMGFYTQHLSDCHVFIPKDYWSLMPRVDPDGDEGDAIKHMFKEMVQDYQKDTSYFASYITLTHEMNNMTVGIGPIKPWILHDTRSFDGVHNTNTSQFSRPTEEVFG